MNSTSDTEPPGPLHSAGYVPENHGCAPRFDLINRQRKVPVDCGEIERFMARIPSSLARSCYTVGLVSDRAIRGYNQEFRGKAESTDVLSFPTGEHSARAGEFLGDILISAETAASNAARFGVRLEDEIKLLILHGLLHLLGQDHERDRGQMARNEQRWAERLGLPQSLLGRSRRLSPRRAVREPAGRNQQ